MPNCLTAESTGTLRGGAKKRIRGGLNWTNLMAQWIKPRDSMLGDQVFEYWVEVNDR